MIQHIKSIATQQFPASEHLSFIRHLHLSESTPTANTPGAIVSATNNRPAANGGQDQNVGNPQAPTPQPTQQPAPPPQAPPTEACPPMGDDTGCPKMGEEGWSDCVLKKSEERQRCLGLERRELLNILSADIPQSGHSKLNQQTDTQDSVHFEHFLTEVGSDRLKWTSPLLLALFIVEIAIWLFGRWELRSSRAATQKAVEELNKLDVPEGLRWRYANRTVITTTTSTTSPDNTTKTSTKESTTKYPGVILEVIGYNEPTIVQIEPPQKYSQ
ncbi:hypothetical protein DFS34DRAFT_653475 [Phlyctochytrium arcticum]|nr:hypothetical protein DFS34DRAFT_653475 [Phlyctochytrium arcticum]